VVEQLSRLINEVYRVAERQLWREGAARTTTAEVTALVAAGQIAVATRDGHIVGCVYIHDVANCAAEFGMLAADPAERRTGVGRALVDFAERLAEERGRRAMQLELLVPRSGRHPHKEFLKAWYGRRGYRVVRTTTVESAHPALAPLLTTPCTIQIYEKPLREEV
jgi:GNAT superfamily N-acetyltransferase